MLSLLSWLGTVRRRDFDSVEYGVERRFPVENFSQDEIEALVEELVD